MLKFYGFRSEGRMLGPGLGQRRRRVLAVAVTLLVGAGAGACGSNVTIGPGSSATTGTGGAPAGSTSGTGGTGGSLASACDAPTGDTYLVDPVNGNDAAASGSGKVMGSASAACSFRTITRALEILGAQPPPGTTIKIVPSGPVSAGETWPIKVPIGMTITAVSAMVTVELPAGATGFRLRKGASLSNLIIDGKNQALTGIVVNTGADLSTRIENVTVQNMSEDGIGVGPNGAITIGQGVSSLTNGTAAAPHSGLKVAGLAVISVLAGQTAASFRDNSGHGVAVIDGGALTVGTDATSAPVVAILSGNQGANLYIRQTPSAAQPNVVQRVTLNASGTSGVQIYGGSSLTLRSSVALANALSGVIVHTYDVNGVISDDISKIDLGTLASAGQNVLQGATGAVPGPNGGAGVCLWINPAAGGILSAQGNTFRGIDCTTLSPGALTRKTVCKGGVDVGIAGQGTPNDVVTDHCTHP